MQDMGGDEEIKVDQLLRRESDSKSESLSDSADGIGGRSRTGGGVTTRGFSTAAAPSVMMAMGYSPRSTPRPPTLTSSRIVASVLVRLRAGERLKTMWISSPVGLLEATLTADGRRRMDLAKVDSLMVK